MLSLTSYQFASTKLPSKERTKAFFCDFYNPPLFLTVFLKGKELQLLNFQVMEQLTGVLSADTSACSPLLGEQKLLSPGRFNAKNEVIQGGPRPSYK